ncbi:laminin domain protein, putative, partial [Rhizoctonia solani AG-3 Rhs1AP]
MADQPAWHPPGQVCQPPELPLYLRNVYDLKPIVGVPSDADVIGIHAVIQAANRVSGVPGMHDPSLLMGLADHLFSAQMAKYRNKYSLITFPSDATYTPPELPAHVSVILEPVSGAPSDDEMTRVQEALRFYQQFGHAPSMFDAHVNMELSQHLFNLQMGICELLVNVTQALYPRHRNDLELPFKWRHRV